MELCHRWVTCCTFIVPILCNGRGTRCIRPGIGCRARGRVSARSQHCCRSEVSCHFWASPKLRRGPARQYNMHHMLDGAHQTLLCTPLAWSIFCLVRNVSNYLWEFTVNRQSRGSLLHLQGRSCWSVCRQRHADRRKVCNALHPHLSLKTAWQVVWGLSALQGAPGGSGPSSSYPLHAEPSMQPL